MPNSEHDEALGRARLNGVIDDPKPVGGKFLRPHDFIKPQSQQQIPNRHVRWPGLIFATQHALSDLENSGRSSQTGGRVQHAADDHLDS